MVAKTQPMVQLEVINVKNIEEFEGQIWKAVEDNDLPESEMYFALQRIAHTLLLETFKKTDEDGN